MKVNLFQKSHFTLTFLVIGIVVVSAVAYLVATDKIALAVDNNGASTPEQLDSDNDGIPDEKELELDTNYLNPDTDNDGLSDYEEVYQYETDPTRADTDGDGYSDGEEVANGYPPNDPSDGLEGIDEDYINSELDNLGLSEQNIVDDGKLSGGEVEDVDDLINQINSSPEITQLEKLSLKNGEDIDVKELVGILGMEENILVKSNRVVPVRDHLRIVEDTEENIKDYINNMDTVILSELPLSDPFYKDELKKSAQIGDFTKFDDLAKAIGKVYGQTEDLPIPSSFADIHARSLEKAMSLTQLLNDFGSLAEAPESSLMALMRIQDLSQDYDQISNDYALLVKKFGLY